MFLCMSSLRIFLLYTILTIGIVENKNIYFTQSIYEIWCQENVLSNALFLYPHRIPPGIYRTSNIKSVVYHLIDDTHHGLFDVKSKRLGDLEFFILNITRPLDINREYQDIYLLHIQANINTDQGAFTEQAKIHLHVADSNDNDGVFDLDIYEKTFSEPLETPYLLLRFHASDADEIPHAQILYEFSSPSFNETFSLHPYTGEFYLISPNNLQTIYEFDIYAYDRHRKHLLNNNIKTKAHVKLIFPSKQTFHRIRTIFNQTIEFPQLISSYQISFFPNSNWNRLNIHQARLTIDISPRSSSFEIFLLNNSSSNSIHLLLDQNEIYLNNHSFQEYNLRILICFSNRTKCQYTTYDLIPALDFNISHFHFQPIQPIWIEENLPIHSFLTKLQLVSNQELNINYKLLNHHIQFNLHPQTGILRLAKPLKYPKYLIEIQADVNFFTKSDSIRTKLEINIREINKYRPVFPNNTLTELVRLPYQFQALDFDQHKQTNGRITYCLWNCSNYCPFQINPYDGILKLRTNDHLIRKKVYHLQIIAFDWGEPISFETRIDIQIDLSSKLNKRDLERSIDSSTQAQTIYLNIGFEQKFASYYLSEDTEINTIIAHLNIAYDSFPLFIHHEKTNPFFYLINDTSIPFIIDQNEQLIQLLNPLDREKQDQYTFEIELTFKSSYLIKLQEIYQSQTNHRSFHFQYSNKYPQKMLVTIYITDMNDNIPLCDIFHQPIFLYENQIQTNLFHVHAFDPDLEIGENGTIIYSLLDHHPYFIINPHTGQISSIQAIDHEQISHLLLHILASDQGQQPQLQSLCMTLHITIIDINDNIPQFSFANYTFAVFSDLSRETIFGQIYAIDADTTDNLIYSIDLNPYIKINQYTGHLRLKSDLYRLINQNLTLTVQVFDGLHTNHTWISIHIKDFPEAQEPILVSEPAYSLIINQSLPIGTIITNVYHRLELAQSSIDFIEIIHEENRIPFSIDQQGSIRLIHSLTDLSNSSFWLSIRLTRYRAHPPHSFIYIHLTIHEDNFYIPQCVNLYEHIKIYDYSIQSPFARVQAVSLYDHIQLEYSIINETIFSIDNQTGFLHLSSTNSFPHLIKSDYLLTIRAFDHQHQLSVDCYLNIHLIQRRQLTPKFFYSSIYHVDLIEIPANSKQLRQRLFQVIALLDHQIYHPNLQIRYRIVDIHQDFIINRQTGYIAARKPLSPYTTYRFNVEAFTVAYHKKWRVVSPRVILPIKIRVLPRNPHPSSLLLTNESVINIDLLPTTQVASTLLQFGMDKKNIHWFIIISDIEHTRYFHVNFQTGELILIRPIEELSNTTNRIELQINITNDWIHINTIKVIIHIKKDKSGLIHFSQTDYYSSVSKTIPVGIEIARLTIENPRKNCTYHIHSVERIHSKNFFHIHPSSAAITILQSLEKSLNERHLLTIISHCPHTSHIASTRFHIHILDKKKSKKEFNYSYRFGQEHYLIIFQTSLINQQRKDLMNLELIKNDNPENKIKPDAQIIEGDPLGLFAIDSSNQSLFLIDESRSRSYIYPIRLFIIDTSQREPINCTVTIFISNIGIQFTCPLDFNPSPYLLTYESIPPNSMDPFTGQQYDHYNSLTIRGFDPFTPSNFAQCFMFNSDISLLPQRMNFLFEKDLYHSYINSSSFIDPHHPKPIHLSIKNRDNYSNPFDITYQFVNPNHLHSFQLDEYTGIIQFLPKNHSFSKYSFLILARYQSFLTFTRLNIFVNHPQQSIYKFQLFHPLVDNYTIGYVNDYPIFDRKMSLRFSLDHTGRLFIQNQTLIFTDETFYDFLIGKSRIQINILSKEIIPCSLNRFPSGHPFIGFIEIPKHLRRNSFYLLNYHHLFVLDQQHGFLYHRHPNQSVQHDLILLIEIENSRCLVTMDGDLSIPHLMIRKGEDLDRDIKNLIDMQQQSSGQIEHPNGTLINFDIVSNHAPIFSRKSYTFSLDIPTNPHKKLFVGQISAQAYNINRSHLVYQFLSPTKHFTINPVNGIIEYIATKDYIQTLEQFPILVRDLIYQQNTTVNITIQIFKPPFIPLLYHQTISETLPPGSIIFQPNISSTQNLQYSLQDYHPNLFAIDSNTGQVTLLNYLSEFFYSFKIHVSPTNQILTLKLTIVDDDNNHSPTFSNLPLNLTISSDETFVTKLSAYDLDLSDNTNLKYYLLDQVQQQIFSIDRKTGIITLKASSNQTYFQLKIGVSDGLHLTTNYLLLTIYNYSRNSPKFSSKEYHFHYHKILGRIFAYDSDPNDQILYQLHLEPNGITINQSSGLITIDQNLFPPTIEFFASASDRAGQIVYTRIQILFPIQPQFSSNLYHISLLRSMQLPSEIFHFQLVDSFNQPLSSTRFEINHTNFLEINQNKLILKAKFPQASIWYFNIYGYWQNFTCQTAIQIRFMEKIIPLNKNFYEFSIEENHLTDNYLIHQFNRSNSSLQILSTPLTTNDCIRNFYLKQNELYFNNSPILSHLCFFEVQLSNDQSIASSQMKILFLHSDFKPKFSANNYYFYTNHNRVFARSANTIRYKLQTNPYGLIIHPTNGIVSFKYRLNLDRIQLFVYAIDEKTNFNDTAVINMIFNQKKDSYIPSEISLCSNTSVSISDRSLPGTVIQDIHLNNNHSNHYYILSGDKYGLFSINNLGKLYLISSNLNRTLEKYFELIILLSSFSISYCRTNISIIRSPQWSYFICPPMSIEWMIEEESPMGTTIGNIKEILLMLNNNSQLIDRLHMKINTPAFHLNSSTGVIRSNSRLDYEQKTFHSFSILLEPSELNCSLFIIIKLLNINDHSIAFDRKSLVYTIDRNNLLPFYIGRIRLIDLDQLFSFRYYLPNSSADIATDSTTGSIILLTKLHGDRVQYDIMAMDSSKQKNLTDVLVINIQDLNDHGPLFAKENYQINISKSLQPGRIIFQLIPIRHGNISYYLRNSSSIFSIDKYTGKIRLNGFLPLTIKNLTLIIDAIEERINSTYRIHVLISIVNDDHMYFNLENIRRCSIDENQFNGTPICTIGKNPNDFLYQLIDPMNLFEILPKSGAIINRKILDYERDKHEFNVTIVVRDRKNQSIVLSSLNLTIYLQNVEDQLWNSTTLLYLFYPSINTVVYQIERPDNEQTNLTYEILNDTFSIYSLRQSSNSTEIILLKSILHNREDNIIIRLRNSKNFDTDINLRLIYLQYDIKSPTILTQIIDGYINLKENSSMINLGQLFIHNHSQYQFIYFNLLPNKHFFLQQLSNNQTDLYFNSFYQSSLLEAQIHLTAIAVFEPIPEIDFSYNTKVFFPSTTKTQSIDIHLWPINREMLDRTVSLLIKINPNTTYEQFIIHHLPIIRQNLAEIIGVHIQHVHIYTYELRENQIELQVAILRSTSTRYIHKKFIYNALQNATNIFENILFNQCQSNPCKNNAYCTNYIHLLPNQYRYFSSNTYQRLIPKYQWNTKCLCPSSYYGERCQFKQDGYSPCSANPCLPMEKCIEQSSTLYSCQCREDLCHRKTSLECININSGTCRDPSNTLTFDGYSSIRMNFTLTSTPSINIIFSFRTYSTEGKLLKLIFYNEKTKTNHSLIIQIINGYIKIEFHEKILLQINDILISDGLWHDMYFSIDSFHSYYLLRLDHVFSDKIIFSQQIHAKNRIHLILGSDFQGCLGNFSLNNQLVFLQPKKDNHSLEFIGTNNGCHLPEVMTDDLCSLYNPCYHGGHCFNDEDLSFTCNCSSSRFTGRQCQIDLSPCESHPCQINEQCLPSSYDSYQSFTCIPLLISRNKSLYIGLIVVFSLCLFFVLLISYRHKPKEDFLKDKPLVSTPLLIHKSSSITNPIDGTMQTLLKSDYNRKRTMSYDPSYESVNRGSSEQKYYSTIEQMNNHSHYSLIDYDKLNSPQTTDLFDLSALPTQYFHHSDHQKDYQIYVNSLSNFPDISDIDFTESSNNSSIKNPNYPKHSFRFNHNHIPTSTLSLPKTAIYARIVKTPKMTNTSGRLTSTPRPFVTPTHTDHDATNELTRYRSRHASDSDLLNGRKSIKFSSFFQTDV